MTLSVDTVVTCQRFVTSASFFVGVYGEDTLVWVGHSGPTLRLLLKWGVAVDRDLFLPLAPGNSNSNNVGQECPTHTQIKMGRQPRSGDVSLAIGPLDPETDRR